MQIKTSNKFQLGFFAILAAFTAKLGPLAMFNLYFVPYWMFVVWLDVVTYLHHHGSQDANEQIPWYRGKVGLSALNSGPLTFEQWESLKPLTDARDMHRKGLLPVGRMPSSAALRKERGSMSGRGKVSRLDWWTGC